MGKWHVPDSCHGFLREQNYGREIVDGLNGLVRYYILDNYFEQYLILKASFDDFKRYSLDDGMLVLRHKSGNIGNANS